MSDAIVESLLEAIKAKAQELKDELQSRVIRLEEIDQKADELLDVLMDIENELKG